MTDYALKITETVARLQKELKCGICCSTYKDPVLSTCFHIFCRSCLNACFERKRKVQCPICRTVLDKRSCRDSYQLTMAVQNYLKLSEAFKKDIADQATFKSLPPEVMFMESQMPLDVTIIPENDGKRCAPEFAIPMLPVRRKRVSKPAPPVSEPEVAVPPPEVKKSEAPAPPPPNPEPIFAKPLPPPPPKIEKKDVGAETDVYKISSAELQSIDVVEHINTLRENEPETDEIDALFQLIPSMRPLLEKNIKALMKKFGIVEPERRVYFAKPAQTEEEIATVAEEEVPEVAQFEDVVAQEDDEVVLDSEGEKEKEPDVHGNNSTLDPDRTVRASQTEEMRIDEELSRVPKVIVCSRIHNDEDEVELLSDFYHKFLSNSCRFSEDVTAHATHLVMMNSDGRSIPQKSIAYLHAVARKCVVVGRHWLVDCLKTGLLLSEAEYTITYCHSSAFIPSPTAEIGWLRSRNDPDGKLFAGYRFMIVRKFTMNPFLDYKQIIALVKICGGEILSSYDNLTPEKLIIVFSPHSKALDESRNMEKLYKCEVVTMEWVLDSISEYSVLPTNQYKAVNSIKTGGAAPE